MNRWNVGLASSATLCRPLVAAALLGIMGGAGCFGVNLPETFEVVLPDDAKQVAEVGTGPVSLADSTWAVHFAQDQLADDGQPGPYGGVIGEGASAEPLEPDDLMVRATFGGQGQAVRFFDNVFYLPDLFGPEFVVDGERHTTPIAGLSYAQVSFGLEVGNEIGLAAPIDVYFAGVKVAQGLAYVWGTISGNRIDGTFGYRTEIFFPFTEFGSGGADQFRFYAVREE